MTSDLKMPVLAPLKLRPKHREGYHSKSQMNILISEQNIKTRNAFRHPNICNVNYTKEGDDESKLNIIKSMVSELLSTCSNEIKDKLILFFKGIIVQSGKNIVRMSNSNSTNDIYDNKLSDLNMKFDYLSKENLKMKKILNEKVDEMHSMYKDFHVSIKKLNIDKIKKLHQRKIPIALSHLLKRSNKMKEHKEKNDENKANDNRNFDFSHLTFNDFNFRSNTEVS